MDSIILWRSDIGTSDPTKFPSSQPTASPTTSNPTKGPATNPTAETANPSTQPSLSPSPAPLDAPSAAPTRFPTVSNAYDSYIDVVYGLRYFSYSTVYALQSDAVDVMLYVERIIEREWCKILTLNDYALASIDASTTLIGQYVLRL
eukprot:1133544_1